VTDEPEQAEGPKDEAEAAAANTATTATTPSSAGDAPVKAGSGDEGEAPPSCGGEVEVDVVGEETNRNETRMDPKNEDEDEDDDDDDTQMPIERGGVEGHTGAIEVEEAEGAKAARDDFSLGSDFTPPSPLSLNSAPVSSDDELLKELAEQETDDIMPTSGAARLPSPGLSPPRLTTTREVAMAGLDEGEGEGEGSGETPGLELNVARWIEKRKRKGEERRRGTKKIKKATAGRGGDGERDQPCAVLSVPSSPRSRAEDNENEEEEEEEQGTQKAAGDEGDSYIDIWDLLPRPLLGSDPEVNASKQRNRERDDNDEEEEGKTTKRWAKRQKREEDGSSGVEDEAEEAVITAVVPASSSSTGVRGSTVDTSAARPPGRALAASPHRQKVPIGEGGQTVVVDIGEEKEEGERRKAKEEKEKEKRAAQSRSRGATGTKGEGWWFKVSGSLSLRSVWPTTTPTAAVGPAGESMHGRQLIPAPLPPPPGQDEDPLLNGRHEEERTMTTPTPTPTSTSTTPTAAPVETTTTSSAENDVSSGSGKRKRRRKRRRRGKQGDGSQADESAGGSLSSEASLSIDGEGGSPEFHVVYDAVAVADREAAHHAGGRWGATEVKEEANDGEHEQASEEMRNAVEEGGGKEEGEASNDNDSGTISDPHPGRLRHANGPRSVAGRTKTKEKGLAMNKVTKKGNGTPKPATRTLGP
jgi:hypothetical protein